MRKQLFLIFAFLLSFCTGRAQSFKFKPDPFTTRVNSSILADPAKPASYNDTLPVAVFDRWNEYLNYMNNMMSPPYTFKSIHDIIKVGVNHDTALHVAAYKYSVSLLVLPYKPTGTGTTPFAPFTITMTVQHDPDSLHAHQDMDVYKFSDFMKFQVVVTGIYDISNPNNPPQLVSRSSLAKNFFIESEVQVQRYDNNGFSIVPSIYEPTPGRLMVNWFLINQSLQNSCNAQITSNMLREIKPISYELEWTYVDDYAVTLGASGPAPSYKFNSSSTIPYDFRRNSTRIQTDKTLFEIPMIYEHGAIVIRIRAIRPDPNTGHKDLLYYPWTLPDSGAVGANDNCMWYLITTPHMNDSLNWAYSINFAEEGKYKHIINYFDGSYKDRQTQTKINTDPNYVIAVDKVYDFEGRPSLTTLPTPVSQQNLSYRPDLTVKVGNQVLTAADIDKLGCSLPDSLPPLANTSPANIYYSPLNPDTFDHHKFIPDAKGYPYAQTLFSPDNTNKVLWQGSAGYELQTFKKPTRFEYMRILPKELDRLQGTEAGKYEFYPKEVVTDPNGQTTFTILNPQGKVVATGLQGLPDTAGKPLDLLTNWVPGDTVCSNILQGLSQQKLFGNLRAENTFYADVNGQNSFKYSVSVPPFFPGCNATNKYLWSAAQLEVKVSTDCGTEMGSIVATVGKDSLLNTNTSMYFASAPQTMILPKGKYMLTKELKFPEYAIKKQVDSFVIKNQPGCYNDEHFFVRKAVENTTFPCADSGNIDPCDMKRKQMIKELYPGGKYGKYSKRNDGSFLLGDTNSIFSFVIDSNSIGNGTIVYQNGTTPQCLVKGCGNTQNCLLGTGCGCVAGAHYFDNPCCAACLNQQCACIKFGMIRTINTTYTTVTTSTYIPSCSPDPAQPLILQNFIRGIQDPCWNFSGSAENYNHLFKQTCNCSQVHATDTITPYGTHELWKYCGNGAPTMHFHNSNMTFQSWNITSGDFWSWKPYVTNLLFQTGGAQSQYEKDCYGMVNVTNYNHSCTTYSTTQVPVHDTTYTPLAGNIYMRYQSNCVTLPMINYNGQLTNLKQVPVDTFIARFNDNIAAALLPLHPEYCKLLSCNDGGYLKQLENFATYKEAEAANRFQLNDIIINDPVYTNTPSSQQGQVYQQLGKMLNLGKSIDRQSIELVYCGAGNHEEVAGCSADIYANEIQNFTFLNSDIKQRYFETLRSLYISNRNFITQKATDKVGNSCAPCPTVRMNLTGTPVFDTVFDANGNLANSDIPDWMRKLFDSAQNGTMSGTGIPSQVDDSMNAIKQAKLNGQVDAIMKRLTNCSLSPTVLQQIRNNILTGGFLVTVSNVTSSITAAGVSLNDLCHPFLVNYNAYDNTGKDDKKFDCKNPALYSGIPSFFNYSGVLTSIQNGTTQTVTLNLNNPFEKAISDYYGGYSSVKVTVTPMNVGQSATSPASADYMDIRIMPNPAPIMPIPAQDELHFYINSDLSNLNSFVPSTGSCLNDVANALKDGLIAQKSAVLNAYVDGSTTLTPFFVWNNKIDLMKAASDASINTCITCKEIKNALVDFQADKTTYGYDDAFNHPLFENTLTSYLNNKLKRSFTFNDYYHLMKGCAVTDKVNLKRYGATYKLIFNSDNDATTFINSLANENIVAQRFKVSGQTQLYIDLNIVPKDSLLWYKDHINTLGGSATKTYLPTTHTLVFAKNSIANLSTSTINLFGSYTTQQIQIDESGNYESYTCYNLNNTYSTPYAHAQAIADIRNALSGQAGVFALYDAELLRSEDYSTTLKQAYLTNVYGIASNDRSDIIDSISTTYLAQNVTAFAGKELSYEDPYCTIQKTDLYVQNALNSSHPGYRKLKDSIFAPISSISSGNIFWQTPYATHTHNGNKIAVIKKVNGFYWYRLLTTSNRMYNAYVKPPKFTQHPLGNYQYSYIKPTYGKDSIKFFNLYLIYNGDTVVCKGYTDFPIGYCQKVENVILQERAEPNYCLDSIDCEHDLLLNAITQGRAAYQLYFDSTSKSIHDSMIRFFVNNAKDTLTLCAQEAKYQYTLYYYDRAGNLTRTVPPQGVTAITSNNTLGQVISNRDNSNINVNSQSLTSHKKVSVYKYNAQNQLYYQETPDGGATYFFYDGAGRLLFSQNSKQRKAGNYSYTLYDKLGRTTETGEVKLGCVLSTNSNATFDTTHCSYTVNGQTYTSIHPPYVEHSHNGGLYPLDTIIKYITKKTRTNVVLTIYDTVGKDLGTLPNEHLSTQENLLRRVSSILYYPVLHNTYNNGANFNHPHFGSYYSYDPQGNVQTITYEYAPLALVGQKYKRVDYEYDVVSGKVTQVSYNRSKADQFFHKYEYDADNRITAAYTSKDGLIWNKDARYKYYHHGPLANVTIGDLKVQSVDYAYTINGWLKAINGDILRPDLDMGRNGISAGMIAGVSGDTLVARDVLAHALDYFVNDYKSITSNNPVHLAANNKNLYNGNIVRQTTSIAGLGNMQRSYRYDQLHRLREARNILMDESSLQALNSPSNLYRSSYTYDHDGNITNLMRYEGSVTPALLDNFVYNYDPAGTNNKLSRVNDQSSISGGRDLQPGQQFGNYEYDAIGNLVKDHQGNIKISWFPNGKPEIIHDTVANTFLKFTYDGLGNRIFKDYIKKISTTQEDHKGEYYVRDASGNILAVYNTHSSYSPIKIIKAVAGTVKADPGFPGFVIDKVATAGSFKLKLINKAVNENSDWANTETAKPISFYLDRDEDLFNRILFTDPAYFNDLQEYEVTSGTNIYANAFFAAESHTESFLHEILRTGTMIPGDPEGAEAIATIKHFDENLPQDLTVPIWNSFGLPHSPDPEENAFSLHTQMRDRHLFAEVASQMRQAVQMNSSEEAANFLRSIVNDETIFRSTKFRYAGSEFEYLLSSVLYAGAPRDLLSNFFDEWAQSPDWLAGNTTLDRRLEIVYDDNTPALVTSFINASLGNDALEEVIADMPEIPALKFASDVLKVFPDAAPAATIGLGVASDTITLAEHHIYGSSRLGIQTYDTTYRNTFHIDTSIARINRLSANKSYYSTAYGDYVKASYKEPWGGVDTGVMTEQRTLGRRYYEMTDHLGNVLATVMDRRTGSGSSGVGTLYDHWKANLASVQDYYPGGMMMPGRWKAIGGDTTLYRYGSQGQFKDNEVYGFANVYAFEYRMQDARTNRFWTPDPLHAKYPHNSDYAFSENRLIDAFELEGLESVIYTVKRHLQQDGTSIKLITEKQIIPNGPLGSGAAVILDKDGKKSYMYGDKSKDIRDFIVSYEGYEKKVYPSVEGGNPTGGIGHKLNDAAERKKFPVGTSLTEAQITKWFNSDWAEKTRIVETHSATKNLTGSQKEAMTDFSFNGLADKLNGFKAEGNEYFFLNYLGGDRGLLRRRIGQTILYRSGEKYNFDFVKDRKDQQTLERLSTKN